MRVCADMTYALCMDEVRCFLRGGPAGAAALQGCYKTLIKHFKLSKQDAHHVRLYVKNRLKEVWDEN